MTPEAAVSDFIAYLDNVRQQLLDAGEDPADHLLTVALDGENWMFMSNSNTKTTPGRSWPNGTADWLSTPPW